VKKLKPRKPKPAPVKWPHRFGHIPTPPDVQVKDTGWVKEDGEGDRDYEADCKETRA
jgi:hypothetical protein